MTIFLVRRDRIAIGAKVHGAQITEVEELNDGSIIVDTEVASVPITVGGNTVTVNVDGARGKLYEVVLNNFRHYSNLRDAKQEGAILLTQEVGLNAKKSCFH